MTTEYDDQAFEREVNHKKMMSKQGKERPKSLADILIEHGIWKPLPVEDNENENNN